MAECRSIVPEKLLCRFFAMARCRDGKRCLFSHDRSVTTTWDNVCRFFLQGRCHYGSQCRYDHVKINSCTVGQNKKNKCSKQNCRLSDEPTVIASSSTSSSVGYDVEFKHTTYKTNFDLVNSSENNTTVTDPSFRTNLSANQEVGIVNATGERNLGHIDSNGSNETVINTETRDWADAPVFIPKSKMLSYAETVKVGQEQLKKPKWTAIICPYYEVGDCPSEGACGYIHGEVCEICGKACLIPFDNEQQQKHKDKCEKELVEDMELSFAIQRSNGKTCGICFDIIMEKNPPSERRFGIMEKCNHIYCLSCIRRWRKVKPDVQYLDNVLDTSVTKACPECRLPSDFVTPSSYYVDNEEEKKKLIDAYKTNLSKKPCKYFRQGKGNCPFGGACFYLHEYPDGTKATLPPPTRRRRQNHNGDLDFVERIFLSDFFDSNDDRFFMQMDFRDLVYVLSDTDDDDVDDDSDESFSFFFEEPL